MRINQEKFEELSQLDRIDFMQRVDRINERYPFILGSIIWLIIGVSAFVLIVDIWTMIRIGESIIDFVGGFICCLVILFVGIILQLCSSSQRAKEFAELEEKFFEIKTRGKK